MWINIDISTGTMLVRESLSRYIDIHVFDIPRYKEGPLISLCLSHLGRSQPQDLTPQGGYTQRDQIRLQRFLSGLRVYTIHTAGKYLRVVKKISQQSAAQITFQTREEGTITVAVQFLLLDYNRRMLIFRRTISGKRTVVPCNFRTYHVSKSAREH